MSAGGGHWCFKRCLLQQCCIAWTGPPAECCQQRAAVTGLWQQGGQSLPVHNEQLSSSPGMGAVRTKLQQTVNAAASHPSSVFSLVGLQASDKGQTWVRWQVFPPGGTETRCQRLQTLSRCVAARRKPPPSPEVPSRSVCRRIISSAGFYKGSRLLAATKYCLQPERPNSPHLHFLEQSATTRGE